MRGMFIVKLALVFLLALAMSPLGAAQKQLAGEWQGTLNAGGNMIPIVWHVVANADGTVTSTFDNQAEGVMGIKVKSLVLKDSALSLEVDDTVEVNGSPITIRGTFAGTVNKDLTEVDGNFTQTEPEPQPTMEISLKRAQTAAPAAAAPQTASQATSTAPAPAPAMGQQGIAGDWTGVLMGQLHLVVHIKAAGDGTLSATMDSLDQGANGIPISAIALKDGKLSMSVDAVHGTYEGTLSKDGKEIDGTWSQGQELPLNLTRAATVPAAPGATAKPSL